MRLGIHERFISGYTFDTARLLDVQHSDGQPDQASDRLLPVQVNESDSHTNYKPSPNSQS